jgi:hypothetical protein
MTTLLTSMRSATVMPTWLRQLRDDLTAQMRADNSGWQEVLKMPEEATDKVAQPK